MLDTLKVISGTIFIANYFTGAKIGFKPNQIAINLQLSNF